MRLPAVPLALLMTGLFFFASCGSVLAATLSLTAISSVDTTGRSGVKTWYYTGPRPMFKGTAAAGATVNVTIDPAKAVSVTADASGNWSYTPPADLPTGENKVSISSDQQTIAFTLMIGQGVPANIAADAATASAGTKGGLPAAGVWEWTVGLFGLGLLLTSLGTYRLLKTPTRA